MGPIFQATTLSLLPEMGRLNRHKIAKLPEGKRKIYGGCGQLRVALYMASPPTVRWDANPREHYQQLRARGKVTKSRWRRASGDLSWAV